MRIMHPLSCVWHNYSGSTRSNATECCCFLPLHTFAPDRGSCVLAFFSWSTHPCFRKTVYMQNLVRAYCRSSFFQSCVSQSTMVKKRHDSSSMTASGQSTSGMTATAWKRRDGIGWRLKYIYRSTAVSPDGWVIVIMLLHQICMQLNDHCRRAFVACIFCSLHLWSRTTVFWTIWNVFTFMWIIKRS